MGVIERAAFDAANRRYQELGNVAPILEGFGMHDHEDMLEMTHEFAHEMMRNYDPDEDTGCGLLQTAMVFGFIAGAIYQKLMSNWTMYGENPSNEG